MRPDSNRGSPYDQPSPSAGNVPEMLEDYRRRRETLETQARELAQLQQDMLKAAERESGAIVSSTRARIASILAEARRDLAELASRVEAIAGPEEEQKPLMPLPRGGMAPPRSQMADPNAVRESLRRARREIGRLLKEAKPDVDIQAADRPTAVMPVERPGAPRPVAERPSAVLPERPVAPPPERPRTAVPLPPAPDSPRASSAAEDSDDEAYRALQESIRRIPIAPRPDVPPDVPPRELFGLPEREERSPFRSALDLNALSEFDLNTLRQSRQVRVIAFVVAALAVVVVIWWMQRSSPGTGSDATPTRQTAPLTPTPPPAATAGRADARVNPPTAPPPDQGARLPAAKGQPAPTTFPAGRAGTPPSASASPAPSPRASPPGAPGASSGDSSSASAELMTTAQRWLDAYGRRDNAAMQAVAARSLSMKVSDQRPPTERLPPSAEGVRRTLEDVSFQFVGETAIMTARLTEQGNIGGRSPHFTSWVSLMWIRESGQWRLMDVQLLSDSQLRQRPGL